MKRIGTCTNDRIELAKPEDKQASVRLYVETFVAGSLQQKRMAKLYQAIWDWKFVQNPDSTISGPTLWVYRRGEQVLGQRGMLPFVLLANGEPTRASWGVDFAVHPAYQRQGIGTRLLEEWFASGHLCAALGSSHRSIALYRKLGLTQVTGVYKMVKLLRPVASVWRVSRWRRKVALISRLVRPRSGCGRSVLSEGISIVAEDPDESWDRPLSDICMEYEFISRRSVQRLHWQFVNHPLFGYEFFVARKAGKLRGYAAVRRGAGYGGLPSAIIGDLLFPVNDPIVGLQLLKDIGALASREGLYAVVARASHEIVRDVLRRAGFFPCRTPVSFFMNLGNAGADEFLPDIASGTKWHVTLADSDAEVKPPAGIAE